MSAAAEPAGAAELTCNQENRIHPKVALAAALVYARSPTGNEAYRSKVVTLLEQARASARDCGNAILSMGRQLTAYVLAADYIDYRNMTGGSAWGSWLAGIRTTSFPSSHSRWFTLTGTAKDTSHNWGTFALASLTAADAYLHDSAGLARDYAIFVDYGDAGTSTFRHIQDYEAAWSCPVGYEINPASCTDSRKEGATVEDAGHGANFPTITNYPAEVAQGYALQSEILAKAGFAAWQANDRQICRNAAWRGRLGNLNFSSADRHVTWVTNARCGLSQPTAAAGFGRGWGFTDWTYAP